MLNHPSSTQPIEQCIREFKEELDGATRLVAHNAKFDCLWLLACGIDISRYQVYCTQVAEYLLRGQDRGGKGDLTLEALSLHYGIPAKIDKAKIFWESGYETDEIPADILVPYGEQDALNCLAIYRKQTALLNAHKLSKLATLQFAFSKVLAEIEYNGLLLDQSRLKELQEEYGHKIDETTGRLLDVLLADVPVEVASVFNIGSNEHLSAALYGGKIKYKGKEEVHKERKDGTVRVYERGCDCTHTLLGLGFAALKGSETKKDGVYKVDLETLSGLKCATVEQKEVIKLLIERSRIEKLKSTYFDGLADKIQPDGCVHPSMNQTVTRTGRLSSSSPNGQNLPRSGTGPTKEIFISRYT